MYCLCRPLLFIIIILLIFFLNLKNNKFINKENYTNVKKKGIVFKAAPESNEKLVFADINGNLNTYDYNDSFSNGLPIKSWKIYEDTNKNLCFKQNDATTGICLTNNNTNSSIKLSNTYSLDELSLKKTKHLNNFAGWAIDGDGSTLLLYVGQYKFYGGDWADTWMHDKIDTIYVFRGFRITCYQHEFIGSTAVCENTDSDMPKRFALGSMGLGNGTSSIKTEWIGY